MSLQSATVVTFKVTSVCVYIYSFYLFLFKDTISVFYIHYIGFEKVKRQQPKHFDNDSIVA